MPFCLHTEFITENNHEMVLKWRKIIFSVSHFFWFILKKNDTTTLCKTSNFNISTFSSFLSTRHSIAEIMPIHHKTENNQSIKHSSIAIALINLNFGLFFFTTRKFTLSHSINMRKWHEQIQRYRISNHIAYMMYGWWMASDWLLWSILLFWWEM